MKAPKLDLLRDDLGDFDSVTRREWLVTNGIGGFASGTVGGARTRRYHGLLVASLKPPLERMLMVAGVDVTASCHGVRYPLATHEYHDGTVHPEGYRYLERFRLNGPVPTWRYTIGDAALELSVCMAAGSNTTYLRIELLRASAPVSLTLAPLVAYRDYHQHNRGQQPYAVLDTQDGIVLMVAEEAPACRLGIDRGEFEHAPLSYWGFRHRAESRRGLDDLEDLFSPGNFHVSLQDGQSVTLTLSAELTAPAADAAFMRSSRRARRLLRTLADDTPDWIRSLTLAADQFIVTRNDAADTTGRTVIAGYPWFGDWGRDTMIALPGLTLPTCRFDVAADILRTFARHVDGGMLPNRFPDAGDIPEYNTVDATLWYFHALDRLLRHGGDQDLACELYPVLVDIIDWHERGTRYGIGVDPSDGLLAAGEPGVQLTWMDAKVGDWVVTPRIGKPVEINALWYRALSTAASIADHAGDQPGKQHFESMASRVSDSFQQRYWNPTTGHLYDVIDGPSDRLPDPSLRPNQILALAVAPELLDRTVARSVMEVSARCLWTPVGLRSLAPTDGDYVSNYQGGPRERDGAYHQGTVWSWLLGPFAIAHYHTYGDARAARGWLRGLAGHLRDACVGQVSEIFDGEPPHRPEGCIAQAWSVAEILRAWLETGHAHSSHEEKSS